MNKKLIWTGLVNASATFVYTSVIAWFMFNASKIFGVQKAFAIPVFMLTVFIVSATVTGFFVLAKPVMFFMDNKKKEAIRLLVFTLIWLVIFCVITALTLIK